jgi:hypothetical protein
MMRKARLCSARPARAGLLCAAVLIPLFLPSCDKNPAANGPGKLTCAELSDSVFAGADSSGPPQYKVLDPNGGETFRVGQTLTVRVAGLNATESILEIWRFSPAGNQHARLPGSPDTSFNPRERCEFSFTVPESLATGTGSAKFSLVSDSLKIRVAHYFDGANRFDYSDSLFGISP